jgi:hypothetical protein
MKKSEMEICPNCRARVAHADYKVHKDGNIGKQIVHFCGYSGVPITISKKEFKRKKPRNATPGGLRKWQRK